MRARLQAIHLVLGLTLALVAIQPGQALAQTPHRFERPDHALQFEIALDARDGLDAFGERRRGKNVRESGAWTMYGRLGILGVESRPGSADDSITFKRGSGPKLGRLTIGIRKQF